MVAKPTADAAARSLRELILAEIRRLAAENGGIPLGKRSFGRATGITEAKWSGRFWSGWADALPEAGYPPNEMVSRYDDRGMTEKVAEFTMELGRVPTAAELRLRRTKDARFPRHGTISNHFPTKADLVSALRTLASSDGYEGLLAILPEAPASAQAAWGPFLKLLEADMLRRPSMAVLPLTADVVERIEALAGELGEVDLDAPIEGDVAL